MGPSRRNYNGEAGKSNGTVEFEMPDAELLEGVNLQEKRERKGNRKGSGKGEGKAKGKGKGKGKSKGKVH